MAAAAEDAGNDERTHLVSMFNAYLEDLGRIGSRHEETRSFYLSLISALFVFLALAGPEGIFGGVPRQVQAVVGVVGMLVCLAWILHMSSFARIYQAKGTALLELEKGLPAKPFAAEKRVRDAQGYIGLTTVDRIIAGACLVLFILLLLIKWAAPVATKAG